MGTAERETVGSAKGLIFIDWYARGWRVYCANPLVLILASLMTAAPTVLARFVPGLGLADFVVYPGLLAGRLLINVRAVRRERVKWNDFLAGFRMFGQVWVAIFVWGLVMLAGILGAVIVAVLLRSAFEVSLPWGVAAGVVVIGLPSVVWTVKYSFAGYAAIDRSLTAGRALDFSESIAQEHRTQLLLAALVGILVGLLQYLPGIREAGSQFFSTTLAVPDGPEIRIGAIPHVISAVLIQPVLNATWAASYVGLATRWEERLTIP